MNRSSTSASTTTMVSHNQSTSHSSLLRSPPTYTIDNVQSKHLASTSSTPRSTTPRLPNHPFTNSHAHMPPSMATGSMSPRLHHHLHTQSKNKDREKDSFDREKERERDYDRGRDRERDRDRERERGLELELERDRGGGEREKSLKRSARAWLDIDEASLLPSNDRNDSYYPKAGRPEFYDDEDDEEREPPLLCGSRRGNWGNKLVRGSRWVRRGKIASWGPARADWEMEERARKRLKRVLPQSPPSSPPMPTLTHLRPVTPPLTASYVPMASQHPNFSSFVLDPSVQHAFTSSNVVELGATATELIEGEGALRRALGALWKALDVDSFRAPAEERNSSRRHTPNYMGNGDNDEDEDDDSSSFRQHMRNGMSEEELPPLQRLFITTQPIMLPGGEPRPLLPQNQVESLEWSLGVLRELADDGREYTDRLEEIREGLAQARAVRKVVWTACREAALDEMEVAPVLD